MTNSLPGFGVEQSISDIKDWITIFENDVEKSSNHAFNHRCFRIKTDCCPLILSKYLYQWKIKYLIKPFSSLGNQYICKTAFLFSGTLSM